MFPILFKIYSLQFALWDILVLESLELTNESYFKKQRAYNFLVNLCIFVSGLL